MKIKVFKNDKNELCYEIPGVGSDKFLMLLFFLGGFSADKIKEKLGDTMPELDIQCELDPSDKRDREGLQGIEMVKAELQKTYP